jgi:hypothetical protein
MVKRVSKFSSKFLQPNRINEPRLTQDVTIFFNTYLYIFPQINNFTTKKPRSVKTQ